MVVGGLGVKRRKRVVSPHKRLEISLQASALLSVMVAAITHQDRVFLGLADQPHPVTDLTNNLVVDGALDERVKANARVITSM